MDTTTRPSLTQMRGHRKDPQRDTRLRRASTRGGRYRRRCSQPHSVRASEGSRVRTIGTECRQGGWTTTGRRSVDRGCILLNGRSLCLPTSVRWSISSFKKFTPWMSVVKGYHDMLTDTVVEILAAENQHRVRGRTFSNRSPRSAMLPVRSWRRRERESPSHEASTC